MIDFIHTFKTEKKGAAQDRKVGQAMSKQKLLDKMERDGELLENPDIESQDNFSLKFPEPGSLRLPVIGELKNVSFRYPKRDLIAQPMHPQEAASSTSAATATHPPAAAPAAAGSASSAPSADEVRKARAAGAPITLLSAPTDEQNSPFLLEDISVKVELTSRIGILGANGCGQFLFFFLEMREGARLVVEERMKRRGKRYGLRSLFASCRSLLSVFFFYIYISLPLRQVHFDQGPFG